MEQQLRKRTRISSRADSSERSVRFWTVLICAVLLLTCGCSTSMVTRPRPYQSRPLPSGAGVPSRTVTASWYGNELSGHRTSSGEVFNPNALTAASRTLPMGSRVAVTNVSNGRTVVVRINDRGPYVKGRSIDLSHAAASQIGLTSKGVGRVEIARADGSHPATAGAISPVSYNTGASTAPRWWSPVWRPSATHHVHRRRYRRRWTRPRIVHDPIGHWIMSALPHF
jgi:rare lipoprotein A